MTKIYILTAVFIGPIIKYYWLNIKMYFIIGVWGAQVILGVYIYFNTVNMDSI